LKSGHGEVKCDKGKSAQSIYKFKGDYLEGKIHGFGEIRYSNGISYKGDWNEGKFHGKGSLAMNKYTYDGDFNRGKREG